MGSETLDTTALLSDIEAVLARAGKHLWLLFDKVDEFHPADPAERRAALEGLFPACMAVRSFFPHIVPRVFIRSDLYGRHIHFTNKSHLADKQFEIRWDTPAMEALILKRHVSTQTFATASHVTLDYGHRYLRIYRRRRCGAGSTPCSRVA